MFHLHEGIIRHSTPSRFDIGYKGEQIEKGEIGWKIISSNFVSSIIGRKSARDLFVLRTFAWKLPFIMEVGSKFLTGLARIISWLFIRNAVIVYGYGCFLSSSIERKCIFMSETFEHPALLRGSAQLFHDRTNFRLLVGRTFPIGYYAFLLRTCSGQTLSESIKWASCKKQT